MKVRDSGMPDQAYWESLLDVTLILDKLEINDQIDSLVEFGAGYGTFTSPSAERIQGNVISFDIEDQMIEIATTRTASHKSKVNIIKRDFIADGTGLDDNSVDYVMLFNILHHINPLEILNETYRILKTGGKAGIIHWNYDPTTPRGPNLDIRQKPEQIKQWAINAGFNLKADKPIDLPPYHYGFLVYKR
ncbi:2-methoxy-6-polyprenyl-1,4-benzoquinol methylase, mitochondrial [Sporomusa silvacetica DSM 10669]|uniref:2-methoxy-6-polyprenyl-1,4-benzoquinol methylase, mitochondrial n=1 Tax=Sporomusa silvacetica DSM 10669 TaxID=1123289 RepID=A0ABZ3INY5_9FIRM|nr:class I SAM-dependent methyltransferase [Sporomusa silvacetica]OZC14048.1 ubiquinone/menaquinone biosynthesis C-methyltransferase UbiE [Sporomusa silvacetica DSM 10669]